MTTPGRPLAQARRLTIGRTVSGRADDRFLVLPLRRSAIVNASVAMQAITTVLQSLIIVLLGLAAGAHYPGGVLGLVVLLAASVLVAMVFSAGVPPRTPSNGMQWWYSVTVSSAGSAHSGPPRAVRGRGDGTGPRSR